MNYALDAIWWRLSQPTIRDLTSLLTAPALWDTGCELPIQILLGETGFRQLLEWNDHPPANLPMPRTLRLGDYAEDLLAYWLQHAPHTHLIARNVPMIKHNQIQGAWDFLAKISGTIYHIELTCKYYGSASNLIDTFCGFNWQDTFLRKKDKLLQQLALSNCEWLEQQHIDEAQVQHVSIVRGMGFYDDTSLPDGFSKSSWHGIWLKNRQIIDLDGYYYLIPRLNYLSPVRIVPQPLLKANQISQTGLYAQVIHRPNGYYHEIQRFMYKSCSE